MGRLDIAVLGFGPVARAIIDKIKTFPEYGLSETDEPRVHIHMVYVNRETYSYGPDLVVPIKDKEGNGSRTYKDGLEAVRQYETTVSYFEDWLLEHAGEGGRLNLIIDCTSYNPDSVNLAFRIANVAKKGLMYLALNRELVDNHIRKLGYNFLLHRATIDGGLSKIQDFDEIVDATVSRVRELFDGGKPWTPVQFSEELMREASKLSEEAAEEMKLVYLNQRSAMVDSILSDGKEHDPSEVRYEALLGPKDLKVLKRFIVEGEGDYKTSKVYDHEQKCWVIKHEMLDWFFAIHRIEDASARLFLRPDLKVTSARYIKYDSPESYTKAFVGNGGCQWCIEYAVDVQDPTWIMYLDNKNYNIATETNEAVGYSAEVGMSGRRPLNTTKNKKADYIYFHLGVPVDGKVPECKCYEDIENDN